MSVTFTRSTVLPGPPELAFDASLNVDYHLQSFAETGEEIVGGVRGGVMRLDDTVTWRARHFGIWWRMTSIISAYSRPDRFVDQQARGPFKSFVHEHRFTEHPQGTVLYDDVQFTAPFGFIGRLVEIIILRRYMERLIDLRNTHLRAFMEGSTHNA